MPLPPPPRAPLEQLQARFDLRRRRPDKEHVADEVESALAAEAAGLAAVARQLQRHEVAVGEQVGERVGVLAATLGHLRVSRPSSHPEAQTLNPEIPVNSAAPHCPTWPGHCQPCPPLSVNPAAKSPAVSRPFSTTFNPCTHTTATTRIPTTTHPLHHPQGSCPLALLSHLLQIFPLLFPCPHHPQVRQLQEVAAALRPGIDDRAAAEEIEEMAARLDGREDIDSPRAPSIVSVSNSLSNPARR